MAVYLIIDCQNGASDVKFDDIILEDVDISKQNVALKKPVATSGECESPAEYGNDGNTRLCGYIMEMVRINGGK